MGLTVVLERRRMFSTPTFRTSGFLGVTAAISFALTFALAFIPRTARAEDPPAAVDHCAKSLKLIGANCAYTTGLMAGRVLAEGQDWRFEGKLVVSSNDLESHVACPFTAADGHVVATELLEVLVDDGGDTRRLLLRGKTLDVDGVRYVVLTTYSVLES